MQLLLSSLLTIRQSEDLVVRGIPREDLERVIDHFVSLLYSNKVSKDVIFELSKAVSEEDVKRLSEFIFDYLTSKNVRREFTDKLGSKSRSFSEAERLRSSGIPKENEDLFNYVLNLRGNYWKSTDNLISDIRIIKTKLAEIENMIVSNYKSDFVEVEKYEKEKNVYKEKSEMRAIYQWQKLERGEKEFYNNDLRQYQKACSVKAGLEYDREFKKGDKVKEFFGPIREKFFKIQSEEYTEVIYKFLGLSEDKGRVASIFNQISDIILKLSTRFEKNC